MTLDDFIDLIEGRSNVSESLIEQFESTLPSSLPASYREFLLRTNGGGIPFDIDLCTATATNGYDGFTGPFSIFGVTGSDTLQENRGIYAGRIPNELLMIASDCFGNGICIGLTAEARGRMYFWDHELECGNGDDWDGALESCDATTLHTESFETYIDGLYLGDG